MNMFLILFAWELELSMAAGVCFAYMQQAGAAGELTSPGAALNSDPQ